MKGKFIKKLFTGLLAVTTALGALPLSASASHPGPLPVTYNESIATLDNPERGFYDSCYLNRQGSENIAKSPEGNLIHLRISLGTFSHEYLKYLGTQPDNYTSGGWEPLSEAFLSSLNQTMNNIRKNGGTAVVRFAYDDFHGIADVEPKMEGILSHIQQLKPFFTENEDVIFAVESGFVGRYGEQHTSKILTPSYSETTRNTIYTLVNALLDVVPPSISVTVRRPTYAAYACGMTMEELQNTEFSKDDKYYRVGVFNDGMFGSESDLGTFRNRKEEIAWLNRQASHTAYGGECTYNRPENEFDYTDGNYVCQEMFLTHTSYLCNGWYEGTLNNWKNTAYLGDDEVYKGQSTYTFFENHMGYRYVLRNFESEHNQIRFSIENVGAGNMLKAKNVSLILMDENREYSEIKTDIDVRNWHSQTMTEETVPLDLTNGNYKVFLKITDKNGNQVQLANDNEFNENGNLIGYTSENFSPVEELPIYDTDGAFLIRNEKDLFTFSELVTKNRYLDGRLAEDILMTENWTPIKYYAGNFDGNGYSISNLNINGKGLEETGFVGCLENKGSIKNLQITSGTVHGDSRVGGIAGRTRENSVIENCTVNLKVTGSYRTAGIVGYSQGTVRRCTNKGEIIGSDTAAGIAAYLKSGSVSECSNYGTVTCDYKAGGIAGDCLSTLSNSNNYGTISGEQRVGGITGYANSASLTDCNNGGTISATIERAGGIAGYLSSGYAENCTNRGEIIGNDDVGGIIGYSNGSSVSYCTNNGTVTGNNRGGGIVGYLYGGNSAGCKNTADVSCDQNAGGVIGYSYETILSNCKNTGNISGTYRTGGITGYLKESSLRMPYYNKGTITGVTYYGNIVGYNNGGTVYK